MLYVDYTGHVVTPANLIGAIVGGIIGAVGGYFLSRWLADKIGLSGWKRKVFIVGLTAIATATAAVMGYFIGPYIANKWSSIRQSIFKHCFEGGTLINTSIGMIPIEEIKEGMLVYSQNVVNGEKNYKTVISTTSHLVYEVVQIKTELEVLVTTESHPFWVGSQGWKNAGDIVKGDELKLEDGNSASVIDIEVIKLEKTNKGV